MRLLLSYCSSAQSSRNRASAWTGHVNTHLQQNKHEVSSRTTRHHTLNHRVYYSTHYSDCAHIAHYTTTIMAERRGVRSSSRRAPTPQPPTRRVTRSACRDVEMPAEAVNPTRRSARQGSVASLASITSESEQESEGGRETRKRAQKHVVVPGQWSPASHVAYFAFATSSFDRNHVLTGLRIRPYHNRRARHTD
jgi:hypothetical protein